MATGTMEPRAGEYSDSVWCACFTSPLCPHPGIGVPGVVTGTAELCLACAERLGELVPTAADDEGAK